MFVQYMPCWIAVKVALSKLSVGCPGTGYRPVALTVERALNVIAIDDNRIIAMIIAVVLFFILFSIFCIFLFS
jgi:hypothetical protein